VSAKLRVTPLDLDASAEAFAPLRLAAQAEGLRMVERLWDDWRSGANRFEAEGEALLGAWAGETLAGVGGLNIDPFARYARVGRLRRFYVEPAHQRRGVGLALVTAALARAWGHFDEVRLRTADPGADAFWRTCGFELWADEDATHRRPIR
jgi:GNAT superfamily N-acetyltransferase